jgi:hypothetical protein
LVGVVLVGVVLVGVVPVVVVPVGVVVVVVGVVVVVVGVVDVGSVGVPGVVGVPAEPNRRMSGITSGKPTSSVSRAGPANGQPSSRAGAAPAGGAAERDAAIATTSPAELTRPADGRIAAPSLDPSEGIVLTVSTQSSAKLSAMLRRGSDCNGEPARRIAVAQRLPWAILRRSIARL